MNARHLISALVLLSTVVGVAAVAGSVAAQDAAQTANETATVDYPDQEVGETVTVAEATLPEGGFVVVFNESGNYVGSSDYLEAGTHENVTVELESEFERGQVSVAQLFQDDGDESYAVGNETAYTADDNVTVSDSAYVSEGDFSRTEADDGTPTEDVTEATDGTDGSDGESTDTTTPGFTAVLTLVALLGAAFLAVRR
ncbi:DUF7282 domain-containing protein [Halorarum salinum]|uniref:PGF-CTERM sorting domain-containing protein n=1 Tax=Halorarum salinum TaxID=2743089 RepID=A0A7D5LA51_9EURY|nr:PGF-CTERM sorting domain-containing protein [Halobaculum salinum]QLG61570.1 PGF-CTERM sorting domain-containing protein [Halobaculum salinum]